MDTPSPSSMGEQASFSHDHPLVVQQLLPASPTPATSNPDLVSVFRQLIDGLPEQIALIDQDWIILAVNEAWTDAADSYGYFELLPGANYRDFCRATAAEGHSPAEVVAAGIADIDAGVRNSFRFTYRGRDRWEGHAFEFHLKRLNILGRTVALATRRDVTELLDLRRLREDFTSSLIEGQADERRRLAREIHDSTQQSLTALSLVLGQLKRARQDDERRTIACTMEELLGQAQRELGSFAFLAHPPQVLEMGLADALRTLVEGYARRAELAVSFDIDVKPDFIWRAAEVALYRVVQEALSNVHRHSRATSASVALTSRRSMLHAVITDNGIGTSFPIRHGVGVPGMRARLRDLGGRLSLRSGSKGTTLIASIPLRSHIRLTGDLAVRNSTTCGSKSVG